MGTFFSTWTFFSPPLQGEGWVGMVLVLGFGLQRSRDSRLTSVCGLSAIHGRQLLSFACPKESNQRKRHPRIRAARGASGSLRANGFRPQAIHGLLSKSARSIAPPACGARGWSVHPPPLLRGDPKGAAKETDMLHISGVAYIRCFCGRDCRALLFPGPSRPRRAGAGNSRVPRTRARAGCARVRSRHTDVP
jgi:hypothetical protein